MSITEINFKCEHCEQEFWADNFNIAAFLYGVFILFGKENEYVGLTCPNCIKTILIKDDSYLVDYTKQNLSSGEHEMSFLFYLVRDKDDDPDYSQGTVPFCSKLRYHSSVRYNLEKNPKLKDFDIPASFMQLTNDFENELNMVIEEHPELQEQFLCPYIPYGEPPMGPYFSIWWFREDQIDDLVKIENDEELRIFPRYIHKIFEIEYIDRFCWDYYLPEEQLHRDKTRLPYDFVNILTAEPSPVELPISHLSSYEFLWKTPHPFEDKGVPRSLIDVDPSQFQKPKKTFVFDEIAGEVRGYFEKGYGLNFINENYEEFIKEYIELAQSSLFSYALIWELKEKYLKLLHDQMYKEVRSKARYAFYSEPPTWTITFDGKTLRGLKSKGFKYIHYLVKNKFRDFGHIDLEPIDGIPVLDTGQAEVDFTKNDYQSDKKGGKTIDAKAMIHGKAFKEIKQEFKDVNESLEDAKRGENLIEIEIAQEKYDEFEKYYYDYFTKHGRSKKFKTEQKNIRDKIAKNIKDALAEIDIHDVTAQKKIWNHFNDALGGLYSKSIAYRPNPDVDWHI